MDEISTEKFILKETFALLLLKGFDAVSISDIQAATGLSRGLLYHYFKNKEDLFIRVTEKYFVLIFDFDIRSVEDYTVDEFFEFICKRFIRIGKTISDIVSESDDSSKEISMLNYHFLFYQIMQRNVLFRNNYKETIEKERIGWEFAIKNSILKMQVKNNVCAKLSSKQLVTLTDGVWFQCIFNKNIHNVVQNLRTTLLHYINYLRL